METRHLHGPHKAPERRSPVTNRTTLHEDIYKVNGHKAVAKRFRDLVDLLLAELGMDASDPTSNQFTLIRTVAFSTVRMEAMEAAHCAELAVGDALYTRMVATRRTARIDLGLDADDQAESSDPPPPSMDELLAVGE